MAAYRLLPLQQPHLREARVELRLRAKHLQPQANPRLHLLERLQHAARCDVQALAGVHHLPPERVVALELRPELEAALHHAHEERLVVGGARGALLAPGGSDRVAGVDERDVVALLAPCQAVGGGGAHDPAAHHQHALRLGASVRWGGGVHGRRWAGCGWRPVRGAGLARNRADAVRKVRLQQPLRLPVLLLLLGGGLPLGRERGGVKRREAGGAQAGGGG